MLLKWAGGKSWLTKNKPEIFDIDRTLQFKNYLEPFLGGGAVFKYLQPNNKSILADINEDLICFYNCLKDQRVLKIYNQFEKSFQCNHNFIVAVMG